MFDDVAEKIVGEAYRSIGIEITTSAMPGERALMIADHAKTDGDINRVAGIEKNYPNLMMVPVAVMNFDAVVIVKKVKFKVDGWESLRPYVIGIRRGTKFAESGTKGMHVESVTQYRELFKMLDKGRIDLVVLARPSVKGVFKQMQSEGDGKVLDGMTVLEPPVAHFKTYHFLHKKHAELVPKMTNALKVMASEGRIKAIQEQELLP